MYAQTVVLTPLDRGGSAESTFDYAVPEELEDAVRVGCLVVVPFGPRRLNGIVVGLTDTPAVANTRPIESMTDPDPVVNAVQIELARWISREYAAPMHACLTTMLPPGVTGRSDTLFSPGPQFDTGKLSPLEQRIVASIRERGPLRAGQLDRALPRTSWQRAGERLVRRGVLQRTSVFAAPQARPKELLTARLISSDAPDTRLDGLRSDVYGAVLAFLQDEEGYCEIGEIYAATGATRYHLNKLAERGVLALESEEVWRDPLEGQVFVATSELPLTADQQPVWESIRAALRGVGAGRFLLHGVTGSGKTEIYLRATAEALMQGRKALILVPEISLTPQTTDRFAARFPGRVAVLHSALTDGERYDTWRRARGGLIDIIVGPRSAVFSPLDPLGLIVLDEEHDDSYKQDAPRPYYHARDVALALGERSGATVILGSATPSLESYLRARRGALRHLEMPRRVMGHGRRLSDLQARFHVTRTAYQAIDGGPAEARFCPLPPVQIVDLRAELRAGNRSIFARPLQAAVDSALDAGEQVILFLNRRGAATFVLCRDCGHVMACPRCAIPLTQHRAHAQLVCHHCNHREPEPERCPACGSARIRYFGLGTERLEGAVHERWPDARVLRWDRDTARSHAGHTRILQRFVEGQADILVGTQMIAKGLDLPRVTLVGVISADTMLNLPDFRSSERTFQLLTQVAGRAGRGLLGGRVVIQTYHPDHYAVVTASHHDYAAFAARELDFRREQGYPPYRRLALLLYEDASAERAQSEAEALAESLRDILERWDRPVADLIGPAPAFFARVRGRSRWQLILRHDDPAEFLRSVPIPPGWRVDVDPVTVL